MSELLLLLLLLGLTLRFVGLASIYWSCFVFKSPLYSCHHLWFFLHALLLQILWTTAWQSQYCERASGLRTECQFRLGVPAWEEIASTPARRSAETSTTTTLARMSTLWRRGPLMEMEKKSVNSHYWCSKLHWATKLIKECTKLGIGWEMLVIFNASM